MTKLNKLKLIGLIAVSTSSSALDLKEIVSPILIDGSYNLYSFDIVSLFGGAEVSIDPFNKGARINGIFTAISNTYYGMFYVVGSVRVGTALTYLNFIDNFKAWNLDFLPGVGFKFTDSIAVEIKPGYSFGGKGLFCEISGVYMINNKARVSLSNNAMHELASNLRKKFGANASSNGKQ